jgi:hypothetical protein
LCNPEAGTLAEKLKIAAHIRAGQWRWYFRTALPISYAIAT